jgi:hypothetical protein
MAKPKEILTLFAGQRRWMGGRSLQIMLARKVYEQVKGNLYNKESFQEPESTIVRDLEGENDQEVEGAEWGDPTQEEDAGTDKNVLACRRSDHGDKQQY